MGGAYQRQLMRDAMVDNKLEDFDGSKMAITDRHSYSQAISLKRIANALEKLTEVSTMPRTYSRGTNCVRSRSE